MDRRQHRSGLSSRHVGVFFATCALHASVIYCAASYAVSDRDSLWHTLQVSFVPAEKPVEPPLAPPIPVLLTDAFAEHQLQEIPPPSIELGVAQEMSQAIHAPTPTPLPDLEFAPQEEHGYGPLTRPRVVSGPRSEDRYPRASIRHGESGRTVVRICISTAGAVESVEVAESSGYPRLDAAAMDISWDYVFAPAMREDQPVPVCLPYGITFRIAVGGGSRNRSRFAGSLTGSRDRSLQR